MPFGTLARRRDGFEDRFLTNRYLWRRLLARQQRRKLTDTGNAERPVDQHGRDIRFVGPWKKWLVWDGSRWSFDRDGLVAAMTKDVVRSIYAEVGEGFDPDERQRIGKWAQQSEHLARRRAIAELARNEPNLPVQPHRLDRVPNLLNCPNGSVEQVLPDPEMRSFVQRAVGWSLTGDVSEQVLFFCRHR